MLFIYFQNRNLLFHLRFFSLTKFASAKMSLHDKFQEHAREMQDLFEKVMEENTNLREENMRLQSEIQQLKFQKIKGNGRGYRRKLIRRSIHHSPVVRDQNLIAC